MKKIKQILLFFCLHLSIFSFAQNTISGYIYDLVTSTPLIGVTILDIHTNIGTITNTDGFFSIDVNHDSIKLQISHLGYEKKYIEGDKKGVIKIYLNPSEYYLNDVTIYSQRAVSRKTPIATSLVKREEIEERIGNQEFPTILKQTPGVHANIQGGGWGDSEIYMRGFDNSNIAIMVNGIPVNDMENGVVYWSNWAGLAEVTHEIQTQRGLTTNLISSPSIGGSINIITKGFEVERNIKFSYSLGNDGYNKIMVSTSSGILKNGWSFSLLGSKTWGDGYAIGTNFSVYNYFINIIKRINTSHQISLTAFGAPQYHYSRSNALKLSEWNKVKDYNLYGKSWMQYNPDYGFDSNGTRKSADYNQYHKPQISINHTWQNSHKFSLSTTLYASIGYGFALSGDANSDKYTEYDWYGSSNGDLNMIFRKPDGTFDYAKIESINQNPSLGSQLVMTNLKTNFQWYGLVSTYRRDFLHNLQLTTNLDVRYYRGQHTNIISDLYGGSYYIDPVRKNIDFHNRKEAYDSDWINEKLHVGDVVHRDYDGHVMQEGISAQLEYSKENITAFLSGSLSNSTFWRYDRLFYDEDKARSSNVNFLGGSIKCGANYNFGKINNAYINVGYISKVPPFKKGIFMSVNNSNVINKDAHNESALMLELGYGMQNKYLNIDINAYLMEWMNKTMTKSGFLGKEQYFINMTGVASKHMGVEFSLKANPLRWLELNTMLSIGHWIWDSDSVKGYAYNSYGQALTENGEVTTIGAVDHAKATINMKGIKVGGSAQTTAAIDILFKPYDGIRIGGGYTLYDRNYAYFSIGGNKLKISKIMNVSDAWKIPIGGCLDIRASYAFSIKNVDFLIGTQVNNVLNQQYIEKAWNPSNISASANAVNPNDVYMFYAQGITWSAKINITFN